MKIFLPILDIGMGLSRTSWALSMMAACHTVLRPHEITFRSISFPYPDGAMNIASNDFLASRCEEMLLIDTDIIFSPKQLGWLLEHNEPLVFGCYPKKQIGLTFPQEWLGDQNPFGGPDPLVEVKRTARGFMRVHRSVLKSLSDHVAIVPNFNGEGFMCEFWKQMPGGHSDDFAFCDLWRSIGGKILVDQRVVAQHEGSAVYPIPGTF